MNDSSENRIDTPMLAISDLDWDNFRAIDIFNILYSLNSNLLTVAIYKTKYGKEIENNTVENVYDKKTIVEYYKQKNKCYKAIATFKTSDDALKTYNLADNLEIEDTLNFLNISFFNGNIPSDNIPVDSASNLEGYEHLNIPESQIYKPREIIIDIDQKRENFMEMVKHKEEYTVEFANDLICMSDDEIDNNKYKELLQYNESKSSEEEDITEDDDMETRKINSNDKKDITEYNISEKRKIKNSDKKDKTENNNLKKKKHNIPEEE
ncbi:ESF1 nucleolar pre-rRNA processing protein, partial [Spraguea lophii 42_110]